MKTKSMLVWGALALGLTVWGCSCEGTNNVDNGDAGTQLDGGGGLQCLNEGVSCSRTSGAQCCTGVCGADGKCPTGGTQCVAAGSQCSSSAQCCTNSCVNGTCSNTACLDVGGSCTSGAQCCTQVCGADGKCGELAGGTSTTKVTGQACTSATECASKNCQNGVCTLSYSCHAYGDVCLQDLDCCNGRCGATVAGQPGRCELQPTGATSCTQDGNPCTDGNQCCTRTCADLGYGAKVCVPAGGCRSTGNACDDNTDCCGGMPGDQSAVTCRTTGQCDNGQGCAPAGNICGSAVYPDGGAVPIPAENNCCMLGGGQSSKLCKLDSAGLPRCWGGTVTTQCPSGFTGQAGCCIDSGQQCQFSDQCCNGGLCLPGADGISRCSAGAVCLGQGAVCTPGADAGASACCAGTVCRLAGEFGYACQLPLTGGGTDGGTPDAGPTCKPNDQACTGAGDCCSGVCTSGKCAAAATCSPESAACTAGSDCCTGLGCVITGGQTTGTCQKATCSSSGQTCTAGSNSCCSGLSCIDPKSGGACSTSSGSCACQVVFQ